MADLHYLTDLFGRSWIYDHERFLGSLVSIAGPVGIGMTVKVGVEGANVFLANNGNKVGPGGLKVGLIILVFWFPDRKQRLG